MQTVISNPWKFAAICEAMLLISLSLNTCMVSYQERYNAKETQQLKDQVDDLHARVAELEER